MLRAVRCSELRGTRKSHEDRYRCVMYKEMMLCSSSAVFLSLAGWHAGHQGERSRGVLIQGLEKLGHIQTLICMC